MAGDVRDLLEGPGRERPGLEPPVLGTVGGDVRERVASLVSRLAAGAEAVDAGSIPAADLEALAQAGMYGISAPVDGGGLGLGYPEVCAVVEQLAAACLATTFVWAQHFRFLEAMLDPGTPAALRASYASPAIRGTTKAGVALTGLMPGPSRLTAEPAPGGWVLSGEAPWVSGWGIVELIVVVARSATGTVVTMLLDGRPQAGLSATPLTLCAANASRTVRLGFTGLFVQADQVISEQPYDAALQRSERLRLNGSFPLGLAKRCCLLLGPSPLDQQLARCRQLLDDAGPAALPEARAAASELAVRAAHALAVARGSASAIAGDVAERTAREASLLLVFASRPAIKASLLQRLGASAVASEGLPPPERAGGGWPGPGRGH